MPKLVPAFVIILMALCIRPAVLLAEENKGLGYPYGKAEYQAAGIQDVIELFQRADSYRELCKREADMVAPLRNVQHYGREAKNWYREILKREPSNACASLNIGYIDLQLGRAESQRSAKEGHFVSATSRFREALEMRPGYSDAYLYLAQVFALQEQYDKAEENLKLILNSGIENSQIHSWMAYVMLKTKRKEEARYHLGRAIELDDPSESAKWSREHRQS